ncbi:hypothetical protein PGT21_017706 [Puccinia graminis f. sp. tritici]|uniref:Uncharacterized protein n=1 Tax=Puccinia graminis f. sp. tritici TaxID=56615 RepID=A0A5B0MRL1_PUCGR|nr:hypothetical protein PGT21_017706 [Puccinia graminis f. sp. tritici]
MAFSIQFISMMICLMSFQNTVNTHPYGNPANRPQSSNMSPAPQSLSLGRSAAKISPSCQLAASGLLDGKFGNCADILGLVSIFQAKESLVSPINSCSQQGLAKASQMIKTGCASDLQEGSIATVTTYSILTHYDVTSGQKITLGEVVSLIFGKLTKADLAFMSVPKETYCTPCGHVIVTKSATMIDVIRKDPVGIKLNYDSSSTVHQISKICGAAFEDQ